MFITRLSRREISGGISYISILALNVTITLTVVLFLKPPVSLAQGPQFDPMHPTESFIKPQGTAEGDIRIWLPQDSVKIPALVTADYIGPETLPPDITYPPGIIGPAFTFALWQGDGISLSQFVPSIVINARYKDEDIPPTAGPAESSLHLNMYNPSTQSWLKLCSSVDVYDNVVSAALSFPTPFEEQGSSLFALTLDDLPPLEQVVDDKMMVTEISVPSSNLKLLVLPATVEVGTNFTLTLAPNLVTGSPVKLLTKPVDIKACRIDHTIPQMDTQQLTGFFFKPIKVGFDYDPDTLSKVGGSANLTIVNLQNGQWADVEQFGSRVVRGRETISVDTTGLGTFGLAVR